MISLAWGGFTNGSVPDSAMTVVDAAGHKLEHVAAAQFLAMQAACLKETGKTFTIAPGADSANRTLAQQHTDWVIYQHGGNTAADPGTSNHGWARAADITGYETAVSGWVFGRYVNLGVVWRWLMANMGRFGFSWDTGKASRESWHFESYNTPSAVASLGATPLTITLPTKEDDMPRIIHITGPAKNEEIWVVDHDQHTKWNLGANRTDMNDVNAFKAWLIAQGAIEVGGIQPASYLAGYRDITALK